MSQQFLNGKVTLLCGDSREVLKTLADASVDSVVCDPPYGLGFMGKKWDTPGALVERKAATENKWDHVGGNHNPSNSIDAARTRRVEAQKFGEWCSEWAAELLRVLKPGGHLVAFSGTRTYHRLAVAIEDAGFEIRDQLAWVYSQGFPKSLDVSKAIDKAAGAEREMGAALYRTGEGAAFKHSGAGKEQLHEAAAKVIYESLPATDAARQWAGWGTALKPSWEPIVLARKPLIGTVAANVLAHGTGALNVDGCRIEGEKAQRGERLTALGRINDDGWQPKPAVAADHLGRWPANLLHDGSKEVVERFPETTSTPFGKPSCGFHDSLGRERMARTDGSTGHTDSGSAARFFYTAKADAEDRLGSKHPTVKPVDLMQWLVRLVTPKGGVCLDPFSGTGTTGEAAWREGCHAILIEREEEYQQDIARRMELAEKPTKRAAVAKTKNKLEQAHEMPLFASLEAAE